MTAKEFNARLDALRPNCDNLTDQLAADLEFSRTMFRIMDEMDERPFPPPPPMGENPFRKCIRLVFHPDAPLWLDAADDDSKLMLKHLMGGETVSRIKWDESTQRLCALHNWDWTVKERAAE